MEDIQRKFNGFYAYLSINHSDLDISKLPYLYHMMQKSHLEKYLRLMIEDVYHVFYSYDNFFLTSAEWYYFDIVYNGRSYKGFFPFKDDLLERMNASVDELSKSDIEIIDNIIELYSKFPAWQLLQWCHDDFYHECMEIYKTTGKREFEAIDLAKHLDDGFGLVDYLKDPDGD